ncbi:NifX-associated nitrogen fixation protein [Pararhodospirillum photometricum]|uniref:Nitrogen fixation protein n=1 Tax=Pararhodospirillum photometricum DSM 122 TaxID=1150469 RepID=H6SMM5_PARPM|nr:NifX-associated nitrogen fixation protein [Pararhodospirillum photometricum]CCG09160.1 Putative uncharacterized protein [Pararhodospirillum photometricum DSM 122]
MTDTLETPFVRQLLRQIRAQDTFGAWEGKPDPELLAPYIITREQRRELPIIADPDPDILDRVEMFYAAVGLTLEQATGLVGAPLMSINHEGFGRVLLTTGRLVVLNLYVRDVHRFGFDSIDALSAKGAALVADAQAMIEQFPEVARA